MARQAASSSFNASLRTVVLSGKDPYGMSEQTAAFTQTLVAEHGEIERFDFDGSSCTLAELLDELRSYGLMQQHKLVVLDQTDVFLTRDGYRQALERYAAAPVEHASLLMRAETWRPGRLDKIVGARVKVADLNEAAAPRWCVDHCRERYGATLDPAAADLLVRRIGPERARLDVEIAKIATAVEPGGTVTPGVVAEMVGLSREEQAWSIQAAILHGGAAAGLAALRELMHTSPRPRQMETLVMWSLADLARKLHAASRMLRQGMPATAAAKQLRLWGDAQRAILDTARRIEPGRLAGLLDAALATDRGIKTGLGNPARSLEVLTVRVADMVRSR